jgi:hypothetical protein
MLGRMSRILKFKVVPALSTDIERTRVRSIVSRFCATSVVCASVLGGRGWSSHIGSFSSRRSKRPIKMYVKPLRLATAVQHRITIRTSCRMITGDR